MKLIPIVLVLFSINTYAQKLTGTVLDDEGYPLIGATVALYKSADTTSYKTTFTATQGVFTFYKAVAGNYLVKVSNIGFLNYKSGSIAYDGKEVKVIEPIRLTKNTNALKDVIVTTVKPPIEVKADKIVFNVENNITATGLDGIELLKRAPGVLVDDEDNISIAGKSGLQIFIDGRPTPLTGKDLGNFIRSLRSTAIDAIEIINNPSAKYDAAGTGGVINIRLRKNKIEGTNGSINTEYQQGVFPKFNNGISLNHRNQRINIFSNYTYNRAVNYSGRHIVRYLADSVFDATTELITHSNAHVYKTGIDYTINSKSVLGLMTDGVLSGNNIFQNRINFIKYGPTNITDRILSVPNKTNSSQNTFNYNLNYHYADAAGRDFNIDANYGLFRSDNTQYQPNIFYDTTIQKVLSTKTYTLQSPSEIGIYTLKTDYEKASNKSKLGLGAKLALINSDNIFTLFNHDNTGKLLYDSTYSNHFIYKENIDAAYVTYLRSYKSLQVQVGLRLEHTNTKGQSIGFTKNALGGYNEYDTLFKRSYTSLFPSASVTFNKNPKNQFTISYSRRIRRPSYLDLNPFDTKADEYGGFKGNPELKPSFAHSFSVTNAYRTYLVTSIGYTVTSQLIVNLPIVYDKVKSNSTPMNLGKSKNINLSINYTYRKKLYSLTSAFTGFYLHNTADYGQGRNLNVKIFSANIFAQNDIKMGKGWVGSLSGRYSSPSLQSAIYRRQGYVTADAAIQKTLLNDKATLRINFSDVFGTLQYRLAGSFTGQRATMEANREFKQLRVSFTYRFGNTKIKQARQRKTGIEDESGRTQQ